MKTRNSDPTMRLIAPAAFTTISILWILSISPGTALAATLYVPMDYSTIQGCIDVAADGDTCLVSPGTYVENINFNGKEIALRSEQGAGVTVIDGNRAGSVVTFDSMESEEAVLDGFMIRNGDAEHGGGILCASLSDPTIVNCTITRNRAAGGGGILCVYGSDPLIANCTIKGNRAVDEGGGGGIVCWVASPTIVNCTITNNTAAYCGGGIFCQDSGNPEIVHCTIASNRADFGGGIYCHFSSSPTITNSILWGNRAGKGPEIWIGDTGYPSTLTVSHSDVRGGRENAFVETGCTLSWLEGNIDLNPRFAGPRNYRLMPGSPCIDAGTDADVADDVDGQPRPYGEGFDMGAYEFCHGMCQARIVPANHGPLAFYMVPVLTLIFFGRRLSGFMS